MTRRKRIDIQIFPVHGMEAGSEKQQERRRVPFTERVC
jgi:hypothetical protein